MTSIIHSPLEQFEVFPLIPLRMGSFDLSFTNSSLLMLFSVLSVVILVQTVAAGNNGYLVPNRWQTIVESLYTGLIGMVSESLGSKGGEYFPFIFALFTFVLTTNLLGLVPYSFTVTSHLIVTLTLSTLVWVGKFIVGWRLHGIKLLGMFLPSGAPFLMVPFLVLIELIGFFITVISLAVRLFANMMAGHILLKVLAGFAWTMMMAGGLLFVAHFLPLGVLFLLMFLETAVAMVQAYVFTLLTCIFLADMIHGGHL